MTSKITLFCLSFFIAHWSFAAGIINLKVKYYNENGELIEKNTIVSTELTAKNAIKEAFKNLNITIDKDDYELYYINIPKGQTLNPDDILENFIHYSFLNLECSN